MKEQPGYQAYKRMAELGRIHIVQVSYPRSGRVWIAQMLGAVTGCWCQAIETGQLSRMDNSLYYHTHLYRFMTDLVFGSVKYVLLVRDPRDSFLSLFVKRERKLNDPNIWVDADKWLEKSCEGWLSHFKVLPYDTIVIQFERMCAFPKETIQRIILFAGLPIKSDISNVIERFDLTRGGQPHLSDYDRYKTHCLKWRREPRFTKKYAQIVWDILGDTMIHYGYLEDGHSVNLVERYLG